MLSVANSDFHLNVTAEIERPEIMRADKVFPIYYEPMETAASVSCSLLFFQLFRQ